METVKIKLAGNEFPFRLGMGAFIEVEKLLNEPIGRIAHRLEKEARLSDISALLYAGIRQGFRKEGKQFAMSYDEFLNLLDDADFSEIEQIMQTIAEQMNPSGGREGWQVQKQKK